MGKYLRLWVDIADIYCIIKASKDTTTNREITMDAYDGMMFVDPPAVDEPLCPNCDDYGCDYCGEDVDDDAAYAEECERELGDFNNDAWDGDDDCYDYDV